MSTPVSAKEFFRLWCEVAAERETDLLKRWEHSGQYTSVVLYDEDAILKAVASRLDLRSYSCGHQGYYWIDGVLYRDEDLFPDCPKGQTWLRRIRVAFEHENDFHSWLSTEVGRLLLVNCELRVLVTYPKSDGDWAELDNIHTFLATTDGSDSISRNESFLLILGWRNRGAHIDWEGRVFKSDQWEVSGTISGANCR